MPAWTVRSTVMLLVVKCRITSKSNRAGTAGLKRLSGRKDQIGDRKDFCGIVLPSRWTINKLLKVPKLQPGGFKPRPWRSERSIDSPSEFFGYELGIHEGQRSFFLVYYDFLIFVYVSRQDHF